MQRKYGKIEDSPSSHQSCQEGQAMEQQDLANIFSWRLVIKLLVWSGYVLVLCGLSIKQYGGLHEMFKRVCLLSPVMMHNLWIWRGTGNANFYFATAIAYACLQIILVVESVSPMLNHDRKLTKLSIAKHQDSKS
ncbi:GPI transamidase subunit PIG-U [Trema orientale]|uniref:GPI transamidase subunit PIG-U n=1 Tax=Trema orientale TaxID=63057 RepID=A0A2P5BBR7_TREOI|nr:GPI transamidase subunit PIG-U [Trema orientale]